MFALVRALILAAAAGAAVVPAASAAPVFATDVLEYNEGFGITQAARRNPGNALGGPDGAFLSLGLDGSVILGFGTAFGTSVTLTEVTFGNRAGHLEKAKVYGLTVLGGPSTLLGSITNSAASITLNFAGVYNFLKIADVSPGGRNRDGFDIDAVSVIAVAPVPLPASGGLLILGVLGLAVLQHRRAARRQA